MLDNSSLILIDNSEDICSVTTDSETMTKKSQRQVCFIGLHFCDYCCLNSVKDNSSGTKIGHLNLVSASLYKSDGHGAV